jgi:hypothetical protein
MERIASGLFHWNISGNRSDRDHSNIGSAQCHDDSHGVVGSGIGID